MPTVTTTTTVTARTTHDDARTFFEGIDGSEETYGKVEVIRTTTTERRADGNVGRLLDKHEKVEVLATLDAEEASVLLRSLSTAIVGSLRVRGGRRP